MDRSLVWLHDQIVNHLTRSLAMCGLLVTCVEAASLNYYARGERETTNVIIDGTAHNGVSTGSFLISIDGVSGLRALCVDVRTSISLGDSFQVNALAPSNAIANWNRVSWLVETYMNPNGASFLGTGSTTTVQWAALQLAVWDLVTDITTGRGFDAGNFRAGSPLASNAGIAASIRTNADSFLTQSASHATYIGTNATVWQHVNGPNARQMLISYYDATPVPEPSTWAMMAAGMGLMLFGSKRLRKTTVAVVTTRSR